jgi:hypothetical protein
MKLTTLENGRAATKSIFLFALGLALAVGMPRLTSAQQSLTAQGSKASETAKKEFTEEWVYRVHYGHEDEWFRIFKKYQVAILERQKQLGFVKQYTVWAPGLHTSEESRWDYRVVIVRASYDAPPGQSEDEVARQLFPDQATFKQEENRRWELTTNHWDLPIHVVNLGAAE